MKKRRETRGLIMCNGNYLFCIERKHVDWSCAMEMFFWQEKKQRHTLIVHVQWKLLFFWEEKKAEKRVDWSCAVDICFFAGKKQRNKYINHVQWNLFKRKRVVWSCAVDICFLAENMWIQHVLDVASSLAVLKPQCQGWNNRRPNQIWKTRCLLPIARTKYY